MLAQIAVAISVAFVWTFRFHNVIAEFKTFGWTLIKHMIKNKDITGPTNSPGLVPRAC